MPEIKNDDIFPLWQFGYCDAPINDDPERVEVSRGRTHQEAWHQIQHINGSFKEPEKVELQDRVGLLLKGSYDADHPYDWLHDAPLWVKIKEGAYDKIWQEAPSTQ